MAEENESADVSNRITAAHDLSCPGCSTRLDTAGLVVERLFG